jgi:hypothetical protein
MVGRWCKFDANRRAIDVSRSTTLSMLVYEM